MKSGICGPASESLMRIGRASSVGLFAMSSAEAAGSNSNARNKVNAATFILQQIRYTPLVALVYRRLRRTHSFSENR